MKLNPLSCYIEELYIYKLMEYFNSLFPNKLVVGSNLDVKMIDSKTTTVLVPAVVLWQASILARPLNLKLIMIEPLSLLLSVHCSLKMYIALDQSPLQFGKFERRRLLTTPYRYFSFFNWNCKNVKDILNHFCTL